jgi:hypothetical protein
MVAISDADKVMMAHRVGDPLRRAEAAGRIASARGGLVDAGTIYGALRELHLDHAAAVSQVVRTVDAWAEGLDPGRDPRLVHIGDDDKLRLADEAARIPTSDEGGLVDLGVQVGQRVQAGQRLEAAFAAAGAWLVQWYGGDNPWPAPAPVGGIQGPLRVDGMGFRDDRGPVLPVLCHFGEAFSAYVRRPADVERELDTIAAAGYDGIRFWDHLGYYDSAWGGKEVTPIRYRNRSGAWVEPTPAYYEQLAAFLRACQARGLVVHHSRGDLNAWPWPEVLAHARRVGEVQRAVGASVVALNESCNEAWQNGVPELARLRAIGEALGSHALRAISAADDGYGGETLEALRDYTWDVAYCHGHRAGSTLDRVRHIFSWGYEGLRPLGRPGWQGEPAGPGIGVTVGREEHPEGLALMAAMALMASQAWVYMSSHGVFWRGPIAAQAGFAEVPRVRVLLPADVMAWPTICHGGESWRGKRVFVGNATGSVRCDHRLSDDGRVTAILYAETPGTHVIPVERAVEGEILHPVTRERWPMRIAAGATLRLDAERGRIFVGRLA